MEEKWTKGEDILNRASAGSLLRGTLHIGDMTDANEYTVTRRHLLSAYESPIVRGPILPMKTGEITLTSEQEFVDFERSIENTEIHFGAGLNFNVLGGSLSTGIEKGKTKATESVYIEGYRHVFFSKIRYEIVPIASFQFDQSKLRLSEEAFDSLKEYCWLIWQHGGVGDSDADKYRACANFFEKFGTHVNVGVFHLGGMLTWKSVFSAKTSSKLNEIKSLVSTSLQAHVKAGFSGFEAGGGIEISAKMLKEQFESKTKFNETDISKTKLSCTVYGGPPGAVSTEDWQKGLAADYTTWVIIDRGDLSFHDHVSVWEILRNDPRAYAFYANYSEHPISEDKIFRDSMHPKKRRRVAADALEQFFSTWLYRRKLKYIMNTANRDLTHESYFDALVQIHTENDVRKVKQKPLKQSEWFQFLQEEVNFSGFVLKLPSVKGITVKALKKIWPEIEYLLDIENGPSNKSADKETIMMKNEQFIYSKDIFELVKKFFKIKSGVKQR